MTAAWPDDPTSREATAVAVVEDFLACVGGGHLADAAAHLAPDVLMVFPGGRQYTSLAALAKASATRYRRVDKVREHYDASTTPDGDVVVVSTGTLFGVNRHGVEYANVRYVDRFVIRDGLIVLQQVWNDLAESGVLDARDLAQLAEKYRADRRAGRGDIAPAARAGAQVRRSATATWAGRLRGGHGSLVLHSGASVPGAFSLESRRGEPSRSTSPEEMLAAAHAACFAMSLRGALDRDASTDGSTDDIADLSVDATCSLCIDETGWRIQQLALHVTAPATTPERLAAAVAVAERTCPISLVVAGNAAVTVTTVAAGS